MVRTQPPRRSTARRGEDVADEADRKHAVWKRKEALKLRRVWRILTLGLWWN